MPKIVDKKEKSARIARAAITVFRRAGFARTRMADIATEAGVGKGTLYEYFRDKSDILRHAFEEYFDTFIQGAARAMEARRSPAYRLFALIDFALLHAAEWEDHCAVYVDYFSAARTDDGDRSFLTRIYGEMKTVLRSLIEEGQAAGEIDNGFDPAVTAELLVSVYDGIVLHRVFEGRGSEPEKIRRDALRLMARGLAKGGR